MRWSGREAGGIVSLAQGNVNEVTSVGIITIGSSAAAISSVNPAFQIRSLAGDAFRFHIEMAEASQIEIPLRDGQGAESRPARIGAGVSTARNLRVTVRRKRAGRIRRPARTSAPGSHLWPRSTLRCASTICSKGKTESITGFSTPPSVSDMRVQIGAGGEMEAALASADRGLLSSRGEHLPEIADDHQKAAAVSERARGREARSRDSHPRLM